MVLFLWVPRITNYQADGSQISTLDGGNNIKGKRFLALQHISYA
jgi:hypothetical protein